MCRAALLVALPLLAGCSTSQCFDGDVAVAAACEPEVAAADQPLTLQIRESCGSTCDKPPECHVEVDGSKVQLSAIGQLCNEPCLATCAERIMECSVPALAAGSYDLVIETRKQATLTVAEGGDDSCTIAQSINTDGYIQVGP